MPFPIAVPIAMAAAGLLKGLTVDAAKESRQRKLAAETSRYSPWTGLAPQQVQEADPLGSAMQFGSAGLGLGQGIQSAAGNEALQNAMLKYYGGWSPKMMGSGGYGRMEEN